MITVTTDHKFDAETGTNQIIHLASDLPPEIRDSDANALRVAFLGTGHDVEVTLKDRLLTVKGFLENPANVVRAAVNHVAEQRSYQHC